MTISYPRPFPSIARFRETPAFHAPADNVAMNRLYGGGIQTAELAEPLWQASYATPNLSAVDRAIWRAWAGTLRGGRTFFGYDPGQPYPLAYGAGYASLTRHAGGAFDGTATLAAFAAGTLGLSNLPSTYLVSVGDYVSVARSNSQRSLHQATEAVAAIAGAVTIPVDPPVPADVTVSAITVQLVKATAIMVLKPGTFAAPSGLSPMPVSFEAIQKLF